MNAANIEKKMMDKKMKEKKKNKTRMHMNSNNKKKKKEENTQTNKIMQNKKLMKKHPRK